MTDRPFKLILQTWFMNLTLEVIERFHTALFAINSEPFHGRDSGQLMLTTCNGTYGDEGGWIMRCEFSEPSREDAEGYQIYDPYTGQAMTISNSARSRNDFNTLLPPEMKWVEVPFPNDPDVPLVVEDKS